MALPVMIYFIIGSSEASIITPQEKVIYNLPYPGISPDHPLYFLKISRDRITEFLTRDHLKKAQLYLLYSDKRIAMSILLAKKGKNQLAINTFSKGEKYFAKIPEILKQAKNQGNSAPSSFIETLKQSNAKHLEVINELIKTFPQGSQDQLNQLLDLNLKIKKDLEKAP